MKIAHVVPRRASGTIGERVLGRTRAQLSTLHVDGVAILSPHEVTDTEIPGAGHAAHVGSRCIFRDGVVALAIFGAWLSLARGSEIRD